MTTTSPPMSPRFAAAVYFALIALVFLIIAKYILLSLAGNLDLPLMGMVFTVMITGAFTGALFGRWLAKPQAWWKVMILGFVLAIVAIFQITCGILIKAYVYEIQWMAQLTNWQDYWVVFGMIFLSVTLIAGVWMIPLTGLAAIYFNKHFLPGLLAVDAQRHHNTPKPDVDSDIQHD